MEVLKAMRQVLSGLSDPLGLLEGVFAACPVPLQLYSVKGQSLLTNRAFLDLFGVAPPPEYNVLEDEVAREQGVLALIRRAFAGETVSVPPVWYDPRELTQVKVSEGRRVAMSATFVPILDAEGGVTHVMVSFRDVTAQLRAQDAARRNRRLSGRLSEIGERLSLAEAPEVNLRALISLCVPEFADWATAALIDPTGRGARAAVVHRDPALAGECERYLAHHARAVIRPESEAAQLHEGRPVFLPQVTAEVLGRFAQDEEHLRLLNVLGISSALLVPLLRSGRVLGALSFLRGEATPPFEDADLAFAEDLAQRAAVWLESARILEEERRARASAERAATLREELLAAAAERLWPPTQALAQKLAALEPPDTAAPELVRISRLAGELRDLSELAAARPPLARAEVDWVPLIRRCVERRRSGAKLAVELPSAAAGFWDPTRLEQLVEHLLENAALRGAGGPVEVRLGQSPERVSLEVRDQGPPLPPETEARLFERFERAPAAHEGLGVGLWISRRLAEAMGGTLTVVSPPGGGATFTATLPRSGEPPPPVRTPP